MERMLGGSMGVDEHNTALWHWGSNPGPPHGKTHTSIVSQLSDPEGHFVRGFLPLTGRGQSTCTVILGNNKRTVWQGPGGGTLD